MSLKSLHKTRHKTQLQTQLKSHLESYDPNFQLLLVKGLSLKIFRPIFLRGTPAQFFFLKKGKMANS